MIFTQICNSVFGVVKIVTLKHFTIPIDEKQYIGLGA
jgi:hypothetical protein